VVKNEDFQNLCLTTLAVVLETKESSIKSQKEKNCRRRRRGQARCHHIWSSVDLSSMDMGKTVATSFCGVRNRWVFKDRVEGH
jgi:hypothetical protein